MTAQTAQTDRIAEERARLELFEAALDGVEVHARAGVVVVRDGADTWLCREDEWDAMVERVADGRIRLVGDADDDDASADNYGTICGAIGGPILTLIGTPRGTREERRQLLAAALAAELVDVDPERYGVEPSWPEGARVEGGETPDDYDVGSVYYDGGRLMVAWDSGVSTPADAGELRPEGTRPIR